MRYIRFTRQDTLHALLGVIPAFLLVTSGHLTVGAAFAIGLLPTSLMGIASSRRLRIIYGLVGCLFGAGVLAGALIFNTHSVIGTVLFFMIISLLATVWASKRPAGGLLLSIILPSLAVGTGYGVAKAGGLMLAFMAGSIWSSLVMLPVPEFAPDKSIKAKLIALQPKHVTTYGVLLGLTASTAIVLGHAWHIPYPGWIATAAMLIMRPVQQMTGWRGVGRAIATIIGTALVVISLSLGLSYFITALLVVLITIITIGARTSRLYITSFGTAFLILTIELYGVTDSAAIHDIGRYRIINNVLGALIALFYGVIVAWLLEKWLSQRAAVAVNQA